MRDAIPAIREKGAELAILGNGTPAMAREFRDELGLDVKLLTNPGLEAYRAAGLRRDLGGVLSPRVMLHAMRALRGGFTQKSTRGDAMQLGGVLVVAPGGKILYRHASREAGDHPAPAEIVASLDASAEPASPRAG